MSVSILYTMLILFAIMASPILIKIFLVHLQHKDSKYQAASGNNLWSILFNTGNYGEFLTFRELEHLPGYNKILTNVYVPKKDGSTTEIDLLMINKAGIYVFESKNYSGWIYGNGKNQYWTQVLKGGKKSRFYNPIFQNKAHINALKTLLENIDSSYFYSYIIFSDRCTLKDVPVTLLNVYVLNRYNLLKALMLDIANKQDVFSDTQIDNIYSILEKHTLVDDETKKQHIKSIENKYKSI